MADGAVGWEAIGPQALPVAWLPPSMAPARAPAWAPPICLCSSAKRGRGRWMPQPLLETMGRGVWDKESVMGRYLY